MGCNESSFYKEIYSIEGVYWKRRSKINHLTLHVREKETEEHIKPKVSRTKEIIKFKIKINDIENRKSVKKINKTKICFFEKINDIDKPLPRIIRKKDEHIH